MLSRQKLPTFDRTRYAAAAGLARGAYVMADAENGKAAVILIASGSEVQLCIAAYEALKRDGVRPASSACRAGSYSSGRTRLP